MNGEEYSNQLQDDSQSATDSAVGLSGSEKDPSSQQPTAYQPPQKRRYHVIFLLLVVCLAVLLTVIWAVIHKRQTKNTDKSQLNTTTIP
ncbi:MAG TPA: hypothetical protein VF809_02070, partial [Candidatus Saccharimonadales bacterium]